MPVAQTTDKTVILLPIWPEFCELIYSGQKRVELRKGNIPLSVQHVVIYETSPIKRVTGFFSVSSVVEESVSKIWRDFGGVSGVTQISFRNYYGDSIHGRVILISSVSRFARECSLKDIGLQDVNPPQSFVYVTHPVWKTLQKKSAAITCAHSEQVVVDEQGGKGR